MGKKPNGGRKTKAQGSRSDLRQKRMLEAIDDLLSQPDAGRWLPHYIVKPIRPMNIRYRNWKKPRYYRGINWFWLGLISAARGYKSPYWLTMPQANKLGGRIRS